MTGPSEPTLIITHYSVSAWRTAELWVDFLTQAEAIAGIRLVKFGTVDPPRKRVASAEACAEQIMRGVERNDDAWFFGVGDGSVDLSIHITAPRASLYPNTLTWSLVGERSHVGGALFDLGNETLRPFYSICDDQLAFRECKPRDRSVDVRAELPGMFWLTFFGTPYVEFFGHEKFAQRRDVSVSPSGATVRLATSPKMVTGEQRDAWIELLGRRSFFDSADFIGKRPGDHALSFDKLAAYHTE